MKIANLKVDFGEPAEIPVDRGTYKTVSPQEHSDIISYYGDGLSMAKIADKLGRSTKTISDHIHCHNSGVNRSGFCAVCKRTKGQYQTVKVSRNRY